MLLGTLHFTLRILHCMSRQCMFHGVHVDADVVCGHRRCSFIMLSAVRVGAQRFVQKSKVSGQVD